MAAGRSTEKVGWLKHLANQERESNESVLERCENRISRLLFLVLHGWLWYTEVFVPA